MTISTRPISLTTHGAIESLAGIVFMLSPIVVPFGAAGLVVVAILGALTTGLGLGQTAPQTDSIDVHRILDSVLILTSAIAALALACAGQVTASVAVALLVAVQACLNLGTTYVEPDARRTPTRWRRVPVGRPRPRSAPRSAGR
jgi:hypothetical protein